MSSSRVLNTEVLFALAVETAKRINAPRRHGGQKEALVSIVFAAVSLEAFLNELIGLAQDFAEYEDAPPVTSAFSRLMSELDKMHSSIELRIQMAHWLLVGRSYDTDSQPYQDFRLLFQIRNDLVHFKPEPLTERGGPKSTPSSVKGLRSKNILNDSSAPECNRSWMHVIGTKAVAEWACNAVSRFAGDLVSRLPAGAWRQTVENVTRTISTVQFPI